MEAQACFLGKDYEGTRCCFLIIMCIDKSLIITTVIFHKNKADFKDGV